MKHLLSSPTPHRGRVYNASVAETTNWIMAYFYWSHGPATHRGGHLLVLTDGGANHGHIMRYNGAYYTLVYTLGWVMAVIKVMAVILSFKHPHRGCLSYSHPKDGHS
jgi:hypothetical protein